MNWSDYESYIEIYPPTEFNYKECLMFLGRSDQELLHQIKAENVYKLIKVDGALILFKISCPSDSIQVEFLISTPPIGAREKVAAYIWEWFDLEKDLNSFYEMASQDKVLQYTVPKYYGLRMICIPDLFEALAWAVMGQQINLTFAYTLKKRFIEIFGESLTFEGETFWLFPTFENIAWIDVEDLRKLQFTARKAEYVIGIAKAMVNGELNKETLLLKQDYVQMQQSLMAIRGIGAWTADYVMMKCLHYSSAFPIADVGLHNALKLQLGLERKPSLEEIKEISNNWKGWQSYATFYLWRSLYD